MGQTKWLTKELNLLEDEYTSEAVRAELRSGHPGALRKASNMIAAKYVLKYSKPFKAETTEELNLRKASRKSGAGRANVKPSSEETPEECIARLDGVADRIYNWVKNHSEKRQARPPAVGKGKANKVKRACCLTGWDLFKRERTWDELRQDQRDEFNTRANDEQQERDQIEEQEETLGKVLTEEEKHDLEKARVKHVERIDLTVEGTLSHWLKLTGMVSLTLFGYMDQYGELHAGIKCAGVDKDGRTFERRLIMERGLFRDRLCNYFEEFMFDCFEELDPVDGVGRKVIWDMAISERVSTAPAESVSASRSTSASASTGSSLPQSGESSGVSAGSLLASSAGSGTGSNAYVEEVTPRAERPSIATQAVSTPQTPVRPMAAVDAVETPEVTPRAALGRFDSLPPVTPQPTIAGSGPKDTLLAVGGGSESGAEAPATALCDSHAIACAGQEVAEAITRTPGATNGVIGVARLTSQGKKVRAQRGKRQTTEVEASPKTAMKTWTSKRDKVGPPTERAGKEVDGAGKSSTTTRSTEENGMRRPQRVRTASSRARQEDL
ncbi:hypothetical protein OBBRIDRAFT_835946 [Obba rivulosa]|uniref:Uncharacterized protein n=1 Tax=Obba rivulosa TaxID=1052685 RepID=A0A8E2DJP8_9APHY|nr:hypothetical protein OBBRIDRAFT_835946 [Obba rivulosa]